jgi:hypothetical protein
MSTLKFVVSCISYPEINLNVCRLVFNVGIGWSSDRAAEIIVQFVKLLAVGMSMDFRLLIIFIIKRFISFARAGRWIIRLASYGKGPESR